MASTVLYSGLIYSLEHLGFIVGSVNRITVTERIKLIISASIPLRKSCLGSKLGDLRSGNPFM